MNIICRCCLVMIIGIACWIVRRGNVAPGDASNPPPCCSKPSSGHRIICVEGYLHRVATALDSFGKVAPTLFSQFCVVRVQYCTKIELLSCLYNFKTRKYLHKSHMHIYCGTLNQNLQMKALFSMFRPPQLNRFHQSYWDNYWDSWGILVSRFHQRTHSCPQCRT